MSSAVPTSSGALFEMIMAAPDDDGPRLVMADQLQAEGDPRGELITLQCALASPKASAKLSRPQRLMLERRERELLAVHGVAWRREVGCETLEPHQCVFRRGFVETVRVQKPNVLGPLAHRDWALSPIREISVETSDVIGKLLVHERLGKTLRVLSVASSGVTPQQLTTLGERFRSLTTLTTDASSVEHVAALENWPALTALKIWHPFVVPKSEPRLHSLVFLADKLTELSLHCICRTPPLDGLHTTVAEVVAETPWSKLKVLDPHLEALGDDGAIAIAQALHLAGLTELVLAAASIGPSGARAIAEAVTFAQLRSLDLSSNAIGDDGAAAIARSSTLTKLEALDLGRNSIGDDGARAIAQSSSLSSTLRHLDLGFHADIRTSAALFADKANLPALESIDLHDSERMTADAKEALKKRFKNRARLPPRIW